MIVFVAMVIDGIWGEPDLLWKRAPHPAVLLGRLVAVLDRTLNKGSAKRLRGVVAVLVLIIVTSGVAWVVRLLPYGWVFEIFIGFTLLAQRSLTEHVSAVARALELGLAEGRNSVAMIVGRDVNALDQAGVARSAIESAAENVSDGVIAPAFWFLVAGLPGILIYKAVNTADSMIGYRTPRYLEFGWAAARLDDVLNLVPARLTALLISVEAFSIAPLRAAFRDAGFHRSPNAGWPEAAMAERIGVALSGPRVYDGELTNDPFVNPGGRHDLGPADIDASVRVLWRIWGVALALVAVSAGLAALS
ncbi:MAG: adenosylcobinamide-phosphate synthase CbiB [Pikeienuella sp.]